MSLYPHKQQPVQSVLPTKAPPGKPRPGGVQPGLLTALQKRIGPNSDSKCQSMCITFYIKRTNKVLPDQSWYFTNLQILTIEIIALGPLSLSITHTPPHTHSDYVNGQWEMKENQIWQNNLTYRLYVLLLYYKIIVWFANFVHRFAWRHKKRV